MAVKLRIAGSRVAPRISGPPQLLGTPCRGGEAGDGHDLTRKPRQRVEQVDGFGQRAGVDAAFVEESLPLGLLGGVVTELAGQPH